MQKYSSEIFDLAIEFCSNTLSLKDIGEFMDNIDGVSDFLSEFAKKYGEEKSYNESKDENKDKVIQPRKNHKKDIK